MYTFIYKNGKETNYTGGDFKSLNKLKKLVISIAEKNSNIVAVRYNNRDRDIVWTSK